MCFTNGDCRPYVTTASLSSFKSSGYLLSAGICGKINGQAKVGFLTTFGWTSFISLYGGSVGSRLNPSVLVSFSFFIYKTF